MSQLYAVASPAEAAAGADILVEATRLTAPEALLHNADLAAGALLVTYGWVRAIEPLLALSVDKLVVDDWEQCTKGGQLHELIEFGELTRARVHAEIGEVTAGLRPGREGAEERILFWHRGFAVSDVMLGDWIYQRALAERVGTRLKLLSAAEE